MDSYKRNTILFFTPFLFCLLFLILFKWILYVTPIEWGSVLVEAIWLVILTFVIGTITVLLSKLKIFNTTKRLLSAQVLLCISGILIQIFFGGIYKEASEPERQPTCIERLQEIENEYTQKKDVDVIDFQYNLISIIRNFEDDEELIEKLKKFINLHLVLPAELKKMSLKEFLDFFDNFEKNGYELIKIGPLRFELRKKEIVTRQ